MSMTPKERFLKAISLQEVDRPPVTCSNQTATVEQMHKIGVSWPDAHKDSKKMAKLAAAAWELTGLEGIGVPFCQTVEAEILGCEIKWDNKENSIPSVPFLGYKSPEDVVVPENILEKGRMPVVLKALEILKEKYGDHIPIMGHVNGPFSLASNLTEPTKMMMMVLRNPDAIPEFCKIAVDVIAEYANAMFDHGADLVVVEDMIASVDLLGPAFYVQFAVPYEKELISKLKGPNILHICGDADPVIEDMLSTGTDCISLDSKANGENAIAISKGKAAVMGNVDALKALMRGTPEDVRANTMESIMAGADLVAPGCSISPLTPDANIKVMVDTVKKYNKKTN